MWRSPAAFALATALVAAGPLAASQDAAPAGLRQWAGDAARTGALPDPGPATDDVLWRTRLDGTTGLFNNILLVGDRAYLSTFADGGGRPYGVTGVWSLDLGTGDATLLEGMPEPFVSWGWNSIRALASDGQRLYSTFRHGVAAHDLDGNFLWDFAPHRDLPVLVEGFADTLCLQPALRGDFLYTACIGANRAGEEVEGAAGAELPLELWFPPTATFAVKLNRTACDAAGPVCDPWTGEGGWLWVKGVTEDARDLGGAGPAVGEVDRAATSQVQSVPTSISVIGDHVVLMMLEHEIFFQATQNELYALDPQLQAVSAHMGRSGAWVLADDDGTTAWNRWTDGPYLFYRTGLDGAGYQAPPGVATLPIPYINVATGSAADNRAYLTLGADGHSLDAVNLAQGYAVDPYWSFQLHQEERAVKAPAYTTMALRGDDLYAASQRFLYRLDVRGGPGAVAAEAHFGLPSEAAAEAWMPASQVVVAGDLVYALSHVSDDADTLLFDARGHGAVLRALDARTLEEAWGATFEDEDAGAKVIAATFAVGDGLALVQARDGEVVAFGQGPTGLQVRAEASQAYPAPGEEVAVDLAGTLAGAHGAATAYRADWGDGTRTDWQPGPVLRHAYAEAGERTARLQARNDAGQTASAFVTFHVGGAPDREPTFLETAFAAEHQDTTWGLIGLLAVGLGALATGARMRQRHRRLRRELEAVEAAFAAMRHHPPACEAALAERRRRARELLLRRRLDEAQLAVVDRRVDELLQSLRMGALDARFDFLPLGLARTLQGILADGRVAGAELDRFLRALDAAPSLTAEQRREVRGLIEDWHRRDAAGS